MAALMLLPSLGKNLGDSRIFGMLKVITQTERFSRSLDLGA
jgi:hypothetical protein